MPNVPPAGRHTVTPRLIVPDPERLVAFLVGVFDVTADFSPDRPSEIHMGDSMLMVSDGGGTRGPMPAFLYVYVTDVDATYARALERGATSIEAPSDQPYGDRRATVRDLWGNLWQVASR